MGIYKNQFEQNHRIHRQLIDQANQKKKLFREVYKTTYTFFEE